MDHVFYSVVIPLYNKEKYILRAVESVLLQSFRDFEIIVVDDASTDNSLEMLTPYLDRVKVFRRESPGPGGYAARNLGIDKAKGKYICFLDADDRWNEHHLSKLHTLTQNFPAATVLSNSWTMVSDKCSVNCNVYTHWSLKYSSYMFTGLEYFKMAARGIRPIHMSASCIRSDFAKADEFFFPSEFGIRNGGDLYAWHLAVAKSDSVAWGAYLGCEYYIGIPNQVVSQTKKNISTAILNDFLYEKVNTNLTKDSLKRCWDRIFNKNIFSIAKNRFKNGISNKELRSKVRFRHDIVFGTCLFLVMALTDFYTILTLRNRKA